jgi:hypothetical protein
LFILIVYVLSYNVISESFAISPSFVRQEIQDGRQDILQIMDYKKI